MAEVAPQFKVLHPDGRLEINPSQPQLEALTSEALVTGMQAGTGSGKTSVLALWLKMEMEKRGPGDYLMAAPTFPLMEPRVLPEFRELFINLLGWGTYSPGHHRFESYQRAPGSMEPAYRIFLGSAANPESLESATVKAACIDELAQRQFTRQAWEAIRRRCGFNNGRIFYATTLYEVSSWYKTEIFDKWKAGDKSYNIIQCDSISNPAYPREQWELAKASLPPWKFNMFHRGIYEKPTGLIYDAFEEETQVIAGFDLHQPQYADWPKYTGHDFGPSNTAGLWLAQDPATGFLYIYREYLKGGLSVGQHAQEWKRLSQGESVRSRSGGAWAEEEARYAYTAAGWPIFKPAIHDVEAGIDQVYSFIAKNQLFVFRECERFVNEILTYTRELDENYEATDKIHAKSRFHLMDCFIQGTMVETEAGPRGIETLQAGDMIATRFGYFPALACQQTRFQCPVYKVSLSNGASLVGTGDHPVWVEGRGFVALDTLRYGDIMVAWQPRPSTTKASPTTVIQTLPAAVTGFISPIRGSASTGLFGKMPTGLFCRVTQSIIRTMTTWTTGWRIWPWSLDQNTPLITAGCGAMTRSTSPGFGPWRPPGIVPVRAGSGILRTVSRLGRNTPGWKRFARSVARLTRLPFPPAVNTATPTAKQPLYVAGVAPAGQANVYNLHVAEHPEYYANGILVHNCLRYLLSGFSPERADTRKEAYMKVRRDGGQHPGRHHPRWRTPKGARIAA